MFLAARELRRSGSEWASMFWVTLACKRVPASAGHSAASDIQREFEDIGNTVRTSSAPSPMVSWS